jgi:pteridine reductase
MNSTNSLSVALVTGAARRIGAAICETLHSNGFNVIIHCHHSLDAANELIQKLNQRRPDSARLLTADLNNFDHIQQLARDTIATWGRLDALVNNASTFFPTPLEQATLQDWDDLINSNLKAPFFLSRELYAELRSTRGCIINICDIFGLRPMPGHSIYSIAKAGNTMLTQSMALEMAPEVRVNGVAPGAILWPENSAGQEVPDPTKLQQIPLGKLGGSQAIADAVLFLVNQAPYITGQIIAVDGGRTLKQ